MKHTQLKHDRVARFVAAGASLVAVGALVLAGATVASADPTPAPTPGDQSSYRLYAAAGSDTIQDVYNALNGASSPIASWNSFPRGSTITTKDRGPAFARPSGSENGVIALSKSKNPASDHLFSNGAGGLVNIEGQLDLALSSSGPATPGSDLTYVPFARDAVSFAVKVPSTTPGTVTAALTASQLKAIYECTSTSITLTNGTKLTVNPKLPEPGSGTGSFFLSAIGNPALGSCVFTRSTIPENDAKVGMTAVGDLIPFSAGQWIAQKNGTVASTFGTGATAPTFRIGNIVSGSSTLYPTAGSGGSLTPGTLYGSTSRAPLPDRGEFARDTYSVILRSEVGACIAGIESSVTTAYATDEAKATISNFGFLNLSYLADRTQYKSAAFTG